MQWLTLLPLGSQFFDDRCALITILSPYSQLHNTGSTLITDDYLEKLDMIRVIELGPFGSRIDRGLIKDLDEIPEGYVATAVDDEDYPLKVFIEPHSECDL